MLIHTVLFWLKKELDATQKADFRQGVETLKKIDSAAAAYVGTPSDTPMRPVIDNSYDICLTVILEDISAHDAYQAHPIHQEFLAKYKEYWETVKIYDAD